MRRTQCNASSAHGEKEEKEEGRGRGTQRRKASYCGIIVVATSTEEQRRTRLTHLGAAVSRKPDLDEPTRILGCDSGGPTRSGITTPLYISGNMRATRVTRTSLVNEEGLHSASRPRRYPHLVWRCRFIRGTVCDSLRRRTYYLVKSRRSL